MPKTREQKKDIVADLKDKLGRAKSVVFGISSGLKVKDNQNLRKKCKEAQSELLVAKKTLLKIALKEAGVKEAGIDELRGNITMAFGYEDEVSAPKAIYNFTKENETIKIAGGIFENNFADAEQITSLAMIPSRDALLAKVVGSLSSPISGLVNVLAGNLRGLIQVLNAISAKGGSASG